MFIIWTNAYVFGRHNNLMVVPIRSTPQRIRFHTEFSKTIKQQSDVRREATNQYNGQWIEQNGYRREVDVEREWNEARDQTHGSIQLNNEIIQNDR